MNSQELLRSVAEARADTGADRKYTVAEARIRCLAFYERELKATLEPQRRGDYLVVDADTFAYEVDERDTTATLRMLQHDPACGPNLYHHRVGYDAAYRIGFTPRRGDQ